MDAILRAELLCDTITLEKPSENATKPESEFSVYRYLDDMHACISGRRFNRKMLRWASIDRYDFKLWCKRRNIPMPEFWFPPSWHLDYDLPENDLLPGYSYLRRDWTAEEWGLWRKEQKATADVSAPARDTSPLESPLGDP